MTLTRGPHVSGHAPPSHEAYRQQHTDKHTHRTQETLRYAQKIAGRQIGAAHTGVGLASRSLCHYGAAGAATPCACEGMMIPLPPLPLASGHGPGVHPPASMGKREIFFPPSSRPAPESDAHLLHPARPCDSQSCSDADALLDFRVSLGTDLLARSQSVPVGYGELSTPAGYDGIGGGHGRQVATELHAPPPPTYSDYQQHSVVSAAFSGDIQTASSSSGSGVVGMGTGSQSLEHPTTTPGSGSQCDMFRALCPRECGSTLSAGSLDTASEIAPSSSTTTAYTTSAHTGVVHTGASAATTQQPPWTFSGLEQEQSRSADDTAFTTGGSGESLPLCGTSREAIPAYAVHSLPVHSTSSEVRGHRGDNATIAPIHQTSRCLADSLGPRRQQQQQQHQTCAHGLARTKPVPEFVQHLLYKANVTRAAYVIALIYLQRVEGNMDPQEGYGCRVSECRNRPLLFHPSRRTCMRTCTR